MIPRFVHKAFAHVCGFFWLPCPVCGEYFGGHQIRTMNHTLWSLDGQHGKVTCPKCPLEYQPLPNGAWAVRTTSLHPVAWFEPPPADCSMKGRLTA